MQLMWVPGSHASICLSVCLSVCPASTPASPPELRPLRHPYREGLVTGGARVEGGAAQVAGEGEQHVVALQVLLQTDRVRQEHQDLGPQERGYILEHSCTSAREYIHATLVVSNPRAEDSREAGLVLKRIVCARDGGSHPPGRHPAGRYAASHVPP